MDCQEQAVEQCACPGDAMLLAGAVHVSREEYGKARELYERFLVTAAPDHALRGAADLMLGEIYRQQGNMPAAIAVFQRVADKGSDGASWVATFAAAEGRYAQGNGRDLLSAYAALLQSTPPRSHARSQKDAARRVGKIFHATGAQAREVLEWADLHPEWTDTFLLEYGQRCFDELGSRSVSNAALAFERLEARTGAPARRGEYRARRILCHRVLASMDWLPESGQRRHDVLATNLLGELARSTPKAIVQAAEGFLEEHIGLTDSYAPFNTKYATSDLYRAVRRRSPALGVCFSQALRSASPPPSGKLILGLTLAPGTAARIEAISSTVVKSLEAPLVQCMIRKLEDNGWPMPEDRILQVRIPLVLVTD